jgi:hypothetical protein
MADRATWARRVAEWRASGLTSTAFCAGQDFTPGGLRNAAHQVDREARARTKSTVHVARVVRASVALEPRAMPVAESTLVVELGGARVRVGRGFDRETFAAVLEVLGARRAAS